jgi:hypothetical protein
VPERRKPRRKPLGYFDAQDRVLRLRSLYTLSGFGVGRAQRIAQEHHRDLDDSIIPEPAEELEDSELSDRERQEAIARERMRREGRI